ncbi:MAG TPA: N-acetylmuramic acid 6-phosphate etherase, partial [Chloroflexota bacterium]|nr:N-acetylmuramic acid 6-phosphate etherase [Chloroflexota bacterium]
GVLNRIADQDATVAAAVRRALPEVARAVDLALERWRRGGRIVLFGAGTSGRLATLDAAELIPTYGTPPERYVARIAGGREALWRPVEGAEDDRAAGAGAAGDLTANDLAFGIAASGRTTWVIAALDEARRRGAATVGLACVARPLLAAACDVVIALETGREAVAGSTRMKAGTAQKMVLNAFSTALMVRLGKVYRNLMVDVQATNEKLRRRALRLVMESTGADDGAAAGALAAAGGSVKLAIAMLRLGLDAAEAARRLEQADGHLAGALGER